ncbi:hypothetical protein MTX78_00520 [Hymenobacter tibetensis]|uniref:Uncharacterized protein n=1 Tax=Hymenobacter tibetensis TaxID=497967 RepID=A0ABY4CXV0_9BACT|nr:hypothetical protein [Hymenobacter tibetensis]UOG75096.1 hypothetical protein MTX78_00520 [Hymenobacter tibetensis]
MILTSLRFGLLLTLVLLTGCYTHKASFSFQPASAQAPQPNRLPQLPAGRSYEPVLASAVMPAPRTITPVEPARTTQRRATQAKALYRVPAGQHTEAASHAAVARHPAQRHPHATTKHGTRHLVLGILLLAGGVTTGLVIGGWAGFGVAALIVLAGYYFLGLAFGGEHAWLEVFQEFFNM